MFEINDINPSRDYRIAPAQQARNNPIIVYCRTGERATRITQSLQQLGSPMLNLLVEVMKPGQ